ncbi:MAG: hypothetical protein IPL99_29360 [Candidatus Competibacteraceae bacterium]|nr:hypothetical protein [Candidatus Competibacteraceae bacterium]
MAEMDVPPLAIENARAIARTYLRQTGTTGGIAAAVHRHLVSRPTPAIRRPWPTCWRIA